MTQSTDAGSSNYATFARFLASDPELSVYRRFRELGARNLLFLQVTLVELEARLRELDDEDGGRRGGDLDAVLSTKCWEAFATQAEKDGTREKEKMEVIKQLRTTLKEYYEALVLHGRVLQLPPPSDRVFRVFRGCFEAERPFVGLAYDLARRPDDDFDFAALSASPEADFLTRFMQDLVGRYSKGSRDETSSSAVKYYSGRHVSRLATVVTVLLASLVIDGAIIVLYLARSEAVRLGLLLLFTSLFAASLALLTEGRRTDIILASAACAAVLVVFVSASQ